MWEYCVDEAKKKKKATRELHPSWWGMIALCRQATEQLSVIFSKATKTLMQHTKESKDISDKYILNQNNNSFYMLLRVELLQSMWPRNILTVLASVQQLLSGLGRLYMQFKS